MKSEDGSVLIIVAILLPVLIGIIGLTIDGGLLLYREAALAEITESAAKSALLMSYDKEFWENERIIKVDLDVATENAVSILSKNSNSVKIENLEIINDVTIKLETSDTVEFSFMKIFGFKSKVINEMQVYSLTE